ncbi:MAG: hypothetical protein LBC87_07325 [Fibromonadaceae bacterium]|jgi:hypothetical protein|nr:hypothetical protein [Fibromonadaceae bacterium]
MQINSNPELVERIDFKTVECCTICNDFLRFNSGYGACKNKNVVGEICLGTPGYTICKFFSKKSIYEEA